MSEDGTGERSRARHEVGNAHDLVVRVPELRIAGAEHDRRDALVDEESRVDAPG